MYRKTHDLLKAVTLGIGCLLLVTVGLLRLTQKSVSAGAVEPTSDNAIITGSLDLVSTQPISEAQEGINRSVKQPVTLSLDPEDDDSTDVSSSNKTATIAAEVAWTTTLILESYESFIATQVYTDQFVGSLPTPYEFDLTGFENDQFSDLIFDWNGSGSCSQQGSLNLIKCEGDVSDLLVSYRYTYTPSILPPLINLTEGMFNDFPVDFVLDFTYPDPLSFYTASVTPTLNISNHLRWEAPDTQQFQTDIILRDPRLTAIYLPVVIK